MKGYIMNYKNVKSRNFGLVLYPNDPKNTTHKQILEYIKSKYQCAYINHNKDVDENGELKKEHTHVIIAFKSPRYISALIKELGIEENLIYSIASLDSQLAYLIHLNDGDKTQYQLSAVNGSLKHKLEKIVNSQNVLSEDDAMQLIFDHIDNFSTPIDMSTFKRWVLENGLYSFFRRSYYCIKDDVISHNDKIYVAQQKRLKEMEAKDDIHFYEFDK